MIETRNLGKTYGAGFWGVRRRPVQALRGVTLSVAPGEIFGIMGPNGAGKTTLLRLLATLLPPSTGTATIGGADLIREPGRVRRLVGLASGEDRGFYWRLSARENLEFFAGLAGMPPRKARCRADEVLDLVDLGHMGRRPVAEYSAGLRQRLGIARALLGEPRALLLDEPTRSLDPLAASGALALTARLARGGAAVVLATHSLDEAQRLCHRVAFLVNGGVGEIVDVAPGTACLESQYRSAVALRR